MSDKRKFVLPLLVLLVALLGAAALLATAPRVAMTTPDRILQAVRVARAEPQTVRLRVRSQGTVAPRTESELIPEVSGPIGVFLFLERCPVSLQNWPPVDRRGRSYRRRGCLIGLDLA